MDTVGACVDISSENTVKFVAEFCGIKDVMYGDRYHVDPNNRKDGEWLRFATAEVEKHDDTTSISSDDGVDMERIHGSSQSVILDNSGDAETIVSATDKDLDNQDVDEEDWNEDSDNQDVGETRQDMSHQADDRHYDDESVSAYIGSEVDPADEDSVADATEVDEDVSDPTDEQESTQEQSPEAKDHTENGRSQSSPDGDNAGAESEPTTTERSLLEKIVLPEGLQRRVERDDTPSEAEKNQLRKRMKERRTGLRQLIGAKNIGVPNNRRQAMSFKCADFWRMAEQEEMAAFKNKEVLGQVKWTEMPKDVKTVKTKSTQSKWMRKASL
ncbi:uncharacterized protein PHALS_03124 [Plasmopara halstedii]|uniref:Uncharacterized protein n=1 Tax=Plasmopara halstedii TaxID=4781 RepID=A0A0P1A8B8_PLAHL|nr:uncharacterized protein PHALS_03124 [Plasmopara halstedii]CEG36577.1 hypothetical protein PHALS_03124 [Plasmopara halstedii]|eukprot:XP_024572946.1 hypothetical protein PHALS_03124 [Plasmopara halstedii]